MAEARSQDETPSATPGNQNTSLSLLVRARANDATAWRRLVDLYQPMVRAWCSRGGVPGNDIEDVMQEVFAAVTAGLGEFRRDRPGDTFRGWLRVITRNKVLLYFRQSRRVPIAEGGSDALEGFEALPDPLGTFTAEDDAAEMGELYRRALEQVRGEFEERTWQIFWLTVVEGRATAALADELGVTPAAIRQAKSRVLRRLKQEVGDLID